MKGKYKLFVTDEVLKCLTPLQKEEKFGDNVFLKVTCSTKNKKTKYIAQLIVYNMKKQKFSNFFERLEIIKILISNAKESNLDALPDEEIKEAKKEVNFFKNIFGKTTEHELPDGTIEFRSGSYDYNTGLKRSKEPSTFFKDGQRVPALAV